MRTHTHMQIHIHSTMLNVHMHRKHGLCDCILKPFSMIKSNKKCTGFNFHLDIDKAITSSLYPFESLSLLSTYLSLLYSCFTPDFILYYLDLNHTACLLFYFILSFITSVCKTIPDPMKNLLCQCFTTIVYT